jgi:cytochrome c556
VQLAWTRKVLAAVAAAAFVGVLAVPGTAKDPLPEGGAAKQQDADLAFLKAAVDKKAKNSIDPIRTTAILVAQNAQNRLGGKDDEQLTGLRDEMLKLAEALSDSDKPNWAAAAKALEAAKTAKGNKKPADLSKVKEFDEVVLMNVFKKAARGGRGWEDDLGEMAKGSKPADADKVLEIAQGAHLVGQLADSFRPTAGAGAKKKDWDKYVADMQKTSKEAAEEAAKGKKADAATLKKKLEAMEANCTACHKVFKTQ